ncbi:MAG: hypothetical protein EBZ50_05575 [Alphaproteobacteria bacterium]|jgi:hypothetical protein|nr:hypothetical protein [Alphaproteobacteria bacterium]
MRNRAVIVLVILAIATVLALVFRDRLASASTGEIAAVVSLLMALLIVGGGALAGGRLGPKPLRNALIWVCIVLGLALAYRGLAPFLPSDFGLR